MRHFTRRLADRLTDEGNVECTALCTGQGYTYTRIMCVMDMDIYLYIIQFPIINSSNTGVTYDKKEEDIYHAYIYIRNDPPITRTKNYKQSFAKQSFAFSFSFFFCFFFSFFFFWPKTKTKQPSSSGCSKVTVCHDLQLGAGVYT